MPAKNLSVWKKGAVYFVLLCFIQLTLAEYTLPLYAYSAVTSQPSVNSGEKSHERQAASDELPIHIPPELGSIEESYTAQTTDYGPAMNDQRAQKTIIYIQDAHDSLEAQENIAGIIEYLVKEHGVETVFEEGYEGEVPTDDFFGFIEDKDIRQKVSYFFLDKLRINGAEYAHINRRDKFKLIGADNVKTHLKNIEWYKKNAEFADRNEKQLASIHGEIENLANAHFPKELKVWMGLKKRFEKNERDIFEYLKRAMDLLPTVTSDPAKHYPNVTNALDLKSKTDAEISRAMSALNPAMIFDEMEKLEKEIAETYLTKNRDIRIFEFHQSLSLLRRLNRIEMTGPEFAQARKTLAAFQTQDAAEFIFAQTGKSFVLSNEWERNIQNAVRFYETADERDQFVATAMDGFLAKQDEKTAVLVFGGFHRDNIREILKSKGLSYYFVTPKITGQNPRHIEYYKQLMSHDQLTFEVAANVRMAARVASLFERDDLNMIYAAARSAEAKQGLELPILLREMDRDIPAILAGEGSLMRAPRPDETLPPVNRSELRKLGVGAGEVLMEEIREVIESAHDQSRVRLYERIMPWDYPYGVVEDETLIGAVLGGNYLFFDSDQRNRLAYLDIRNRTIYMSRPLVLHFELFPQIGELILRRFLHVLKNPFVSDKTLDDLYPNPDLAILEKLIALEDEADFLIEKPYYSSLLFFAATHGNWEDRFQIFSLVARTFLQGAWAGLKGLSENLAALFFSLPLSFYRKVVRHADYKVWQWAQAARQRDLNTYLGKESYERTDTVQAIVRDFSKSERNGSRLIFMALGDHHGDVREAAIKAVAEVNLAQALPVLRWLVDPGSHEPHEKVRIAAGESIKIIENANQSQRSETRREDALPALRHERRSGNKTILYHTILPSMDMSGNLKQPVEIIQVDDEFYFSLQDPESPQIIHFDPANHRLFIPELLASRLNETSIDLNSAFDALVRLAIDVANTSDGENFNLNELVEANDFYESLQFELEIVHERWKASQQKPSLSLLPRFLETISDILGRGENRQQPRSEIRGFETGAAILEHIRDIKGPNLGIKKGSIDIEDVRGSLLTAAEEGRVYYRRRIKPWHIDNAELDETLNLVAVKKDHFLFYRDENNYQLAFINAANKTVYMPALFIDHLNNTGLLQSAIEDFISFYDEALKLDELTQESFDGLLEKFMDEHAPLRDAVDAASELGIWSQQWKPGDGPNRFPLRKQIERAMNAFYYVSFILPQALITTAVILSQNTLQRFVIKPLRRSLISLNDRIAEKIPLFDVHHVLWSASWRRIQAEIQLAAGNDAQRRLRLIDQIREDPDDQGIELLRKFVADKDPRVRAEAIRALGELQDPETLRFARWILGPDSHEKEAIVQAAAQQALQLTRQSRSETRQDELRRNFFNAPLEDPETLPYIRMIFPSAYLEQLASQGYDIDHLLGNYEVSGSPEPDRTVELKAKPLGNSAVWFKLTVGNSRTPLTHIPLTDRGHYLELAPGGFPPKDFEAAKEVNGTVPTEQSVFARESVTSYMVKHNFAPLAKALGFEKLGINESDSSGSTQHSLWNMGFRPSSKPTAIREEALKVRNDLWLADVNEILNRSESRGPDRFDRMLETVSAGRAMTDLDKLVLIQGYLRLSKADFVELLRKKSHGKINITAAVLNNYKLETTYLPGDFIERTLKALRFELAKNFKVMRQLLEMKEVEFGELLNPDEPVTSEQVTQWETGRQEIPLDMLFRSYQIYKEHAGNKLFRVRDRSGLSPSVFVKALKNFPSSLATRQFLVYEEGEEFVPFDLLKSALQVLKDRTGDTGVLKREGRDFRSMREFLGRDRNLLAAEFGVEVTEIRNWENGKTPVSFTAREKIESLVKAEIGNGAKQRMEAIAAILPFGPTELSERLGYDPSYATRWLKGERPIPLMASVRAETLVTRYSREAKRALFYEDGDIEENYRGILRMLMPEPLLQELTDQGYIVPAAFGLFKKTNPDVKAEKPLKLITFATKSHGMFSLGLRDGTTGELIAAINLFDQGEVLHIGAGKLRSFEEAVGAYPELERNRSMAWWFENNLLKLKELLGYKAVTIPYRGISADTLSHLRFQPLEEDAAADRAYWVYGLAEGFMPEPRSEVRAIKQALFHDEEKAHSYRDRVERLIPEPLKKRDTLRAVSAQGILSLSLPDEVSRRPRFSAMLHDQGERLFLNTFSADSFKEAGQFNANRRKKVTESDQIFAYWFENHLVPFASELGFSEVSVSQMGYQPSSLQNLGLSRDGKDKGISTVWVYDLGRRSESRSSEDDHAEKTRHAIFYEPGIPKSLMPYLRMLIPPEILKYFANEGYMIPREYGNFSPRLDEFHSAAKTLEIEIESGHREHELSIVFRNEATGEMLVEILLFDHPDTLLVSTGYIPPIPEAMALDLESNKRLVWWFQHALVPFAESLHYRTIEVHARNNDVHKTFRLMGMTPDKSDKIGVGSNWSLNLDTLDHVAFDAIGSPELDSPNQRSDIRAIDATFNPDAARKFLFHRGTGSVVPYQAYINSLIPPEFLQELANAGFKVHEKLGKYEPESGIKPDKSFHQSITRTEGTLGIWVRDAAKQSRHPSLPFSVVLADFGDELRVADVFSEGKLSDPKEFERWRQKYLKPFAASLGFKKVKLIKIEKGQKRTAEQVDIIFQSETAATRLFRTVEDDAADVLKAKLAQEAAVQRQAEREAAAVTQQAERERRRELRLRPMARVLSLYRLGMISKDQYRHTMKSLISRELSRSKNQSRTMDEIRDAFGGDFVHEMGFSWMGESLQRDATQMMKNFDRMPAAENAKGVLLGLGIENKMYLTFEKGGRDVRGGVKGTRFVKVLGDGPEVPIFFIPSDMLLYHDLKYIREYSHPFEDQVKEARQFFSSLARPFEIMPGDLLDFDGIYFALGILPNPRGTSVDERTRVRKGKSIKERTVVLNTQMLAYDLFNKALVKERIPVTMVRAELFEESQPGQWSKISEEINLHVNYDDLTEVLPRAEKTRKIKLIDEAGAELQINFGTNGRYVKQYPGQNAAEIFEGNDAAEIKVMTEDSAKLKAAGYTIQDLRDYFSESEETIITPPFYLEYDGKSYGAAVTETEKRNHLLVIDLKSPKAAARKIPVRFSMRKGKEVITVYYPTLARVFKEFHHTIKLPSRSETRALDEEGLELYREESLHVEVTSAEVTQSLEDPSGPAMVYVDFRDYRDRFSPDQRKELFAHAYTNRSELRVVFYNADPTDERLKPFRELNRRGRNIWITDADAQEAFEATQAGFVKGWDKFTNIHLSKGDQDAMAAFDPESRTNIHFFRQKTGKEKSGSLSAALLWKKYREADRWLQGIVVDEDGYLTVVEGYLSELLQNQQGDLVILMSA